MFKEFVFVELKDHSYRHAYVPFGQGWIIGGRYFYNPRQAPDMEEWPVEVPIPWARDHV